MMSVIRRSVLRGLAAVPLAIALPPRIASADVGRFLGTVVARWADNGRDMILIESFEFVAPDGQRWPVPAGATVNGASIPRIFWSLIGGPFEGRYRKASVVHDYYCDIQVRSYRAVHRAFYDAMMASGVAPSKAWLMFQAVNRFGPRWAITVASAPRDSDDGTWRYRRRGFTAPAPAQPVLNRQELETFLADVEYRADPEDVAKLRRQAKKLR